MSLRRLLKAMFSAPVHHPIKPATTTVHICLKDGSERSFRYPGILKGYVLDIRLDAVMDEMDDGNILSPIKIFRDYGDGSVRTEDLKIYSPVDD